VQRGKAWRHQVTDLPERVVAQVTEYRLYRGVCGHCRKAHATKLPAGVPQGQIGPRALALIGVLGTTYHLTQGKITTLRGQVLGVKFSVGAVSQAQGVVAQALKAPVQAAAASCRSAPVLHLDETSRPTNNAAEQALRTLVLKRKICGPTRSQRGQQFVAWGYTLTESCRRQGRDVLGSMEHAIRAWLGGAPALSLIPASG
jgi:hypothetical protein